ncbi:hypothetical protein LP414_27160 [Polaromonas sp. P1(28)-13]|nr:hypothetical protein LP414_27160 [Polaromonas sp. P1(28)-13]
MLTKANLRLATTLNIQQFADLLEASVIHQTLDIGMTIIHKITHPERGNMVLVNTSGELSGCMPI